MKSRCTKTAATASSWGCRRLGPGSSPPRRRPCRPAPVDAPDHRPSVSTISRAAKARPLVEGVERGAEGQGHEQLADDLAAKISTRLRGGWRGPQVVDASDASGQLGRRSRGHIGTAKSRPEDADHHDGDHDQPHQVWRLLPDPPPVLCRLGREVDCDRAIGDGDDEEPPFTIQLAVEISTPELTASVAS